MKKKTKINRTVATLAANPRNPNKMADEDKARMAKSLAEFGDLSGIVFNRRTKQLVGGHQRSDVMQTGKIIITENLAKPDRDGTVARGYIEHLGVQYQYREVDWPESRANAAMLAANRFGRVGEDNPGILKDVLLELDTGAFDTDLTGYDNATLEDMMTACAPELPSVPALELRPYEHFDYVVVLADNVNDWEWLCEFCALEKVDGRNEKSGEKIGLGRGIKASVLIAKIKEVISETGLRSSDTVKKKE